MKAMYRLLPVFFLSATASAKITPNATIEVVNSKVEAHSVYDQGRKIEVTLEGNYPDSCFKPAEAKVTRAGNEIFITDQAVVLENRLCTEALVPFQRTIDLGDLPRGIYDLYSHDGRAFRQATRIEVR